MVATPSSDMIRRRVPALFLIFLLLFLLLALRLVWVQVIQSVKYSELAVNTRTRGVKVEAKRGDILDRNGKVLAMSISSDSVYAIPGEIKEPEQAAQVLSDALGMNYKDVLNRITRQQFHVYIRHKITPTQSKIIREARLSGIGLEARSQRFYPLNNRASHILGFAGTDNQGLYGVEVAYESVLQGTAGRLTAEYDARGKEIPGAMHSYTAPVDGQTLQLTVDETIQYIAERELEKAVLANKVKRGTVIVMDVKSGGILAMASYPDFNPNTPFQADASIWRNPAVSDSYEPGSTFKIITMAAALGEDAVNSKETFKCDGHISIPGATIRCIRAHGTQTLVQAAETSCNVAFVTLGLRLGTAKLYEYISAFNFGTKTGIDYPGEAAGILLPENKVRQVDLARISFGQAITVTPLQMVAAAAAVANDGVYMKPYMVERILSSSGEVIDEIENAEGIRLISSEDSKLMCSILESVVRNGSGRNAYIDGYRVAGKTGTAQKIINGAYSEDKYIASFLGFAPADNPRIAVIVIMDEPSGSYYYGGQVAAPAFRIIVHDTLQTLGVLPEGSNSDQINPGQQTIVTVPDVIGKTESTAVSRLDKIGLKYKIAMSGDVVAYQIPESGEQVPYHTTVRLYFKDKVASNQLIVPDVRGLTMLQVAEILEIYGLVMVPTGTGNSVTQTPAPGATLTKGQVVQVEFK